MGQAEHITKKPKIDRVMEFIKSQNPTLSPALNRTWINSSEMSGRTTDGISSY